MTINTDQIVSMTAANQNFSAVAKIVNKNGSAVVFKNNRPKYMILDLDNSSYIDLTDDEKFEIVSKRILLQYLDAFKELAK